MTQVLVAAWVGVTVGWVGFGWALAEAPNETVAQVAFAPAGTEPTVLASVKTVVQG